MSEYIPLGSNCDLHIFISLLHWGLFFSKIRSAFGGVLLFRKDNRMSGSCFSCGQKEKKIGRCAYAYSVLEV